MSKTTRELAVEAAVEYAKSWNASTTSSPMKSDEFVELLEKLYATIGSFDKKSAS